MSGDADPPQRAYVTDPEELRFLWHFRSRSRPVRQKMLAAMTALANRRPAHETRRLLLDWLRAERSPSPEQVAAKLLRPELVMVAPEPPPSPKPVPPGGPRPAV